MCGLRVTLVPEVFLASSAAALVLSSYAEKNQTSVTGVLTSPFFTYHWNHVDFPVCRFGYKKLIITRLVQV